MRFCPLTTKKIYKGVMKTLLGGVLLLAVQKFCHQKTEGFAVLKIREAFLESDLSSEEGERQQALSILSQQLTYLGRGGQCYAFASEDGRYVVKLLKYNNNTPRVWFRLCPFPFGLENYRQEKLASKKRKLEGEYKSYRIALQELKEETGILYFHLSQGQLPNTFLHLKDKLGIFHHLPADHYQFYIQKRGTPFYPKLQSLISSGQLQTAKDAIDTIVSFLLKRCKKKITDGDDGIWRNFAFFEDLPFQIDIGQFSLKEDLNCPDQYEDDLLFFTKDFSRWLAEVSPELHDHLLSTIHAKTHAE